MCGYFFVLLKARNHSAKSSFHMHLNLEDDFGKKGATLSKNKPGVWRYPNSAPKSIHERIKLEGANCNKSIVSYGNLQGTFGVLDLNVLADNDWGNTISWLINGGANGFDDRIKYRNLLKEIMKYELCKNKK